MAAEEFSLPYVDTELEAGAGVVDAELAAEYAAVPYDAQAYAAALPPLPACMENGGGGAVALEPRLDLSRYSVPEPATAEEVGPAVGNAAAVLEIAGARLMNAELGKEHAVGEWKAAVEQKEALIDAMTAALKRVEEEDEKVNRARAEAQLAKAGKIRGLESEYQQLVMKNAAIAEAVDNLRERMVGVAPKFKTLYVFESPVATLVEIKRTDAPAHVTDKGLIYHWVVIGGAQAGEAGPGPVSAPQQVVKMTFEAMPSATSRTFGEAFLEMASDFSSAHLRFRVAGAQTIDLVARQGLDDLSSMIVAAWLSQMPWPASE
ncbi:uncharacterized protein AMSG_11060 [Thecamonas trahens ATCC 50062]|uniref:Uncharacterized protein n=1 Tax=Thecamonas trahens ATCC 50062 TaxID=461836 RepID=A0A0L0DT02_THETB|nr:hypothetical protein AMSG_11060 [Thecamonas trahens ATCC 50062]KNC55400.1 hypothetical protein AMSG_11060 [Thecamonas trahens ATCC 50062]|eukprot:XP_013753031.1 hypothetical protein AMSG_11060 [Thecamonas trahens ATCC 50062]